MTVAVSVDLKPILDFNKLSEAMHSNLHLHHKQSITYKSDILDSVQQNGFHLQFPFHCKNTDSF